MGNPVLFVHGIGASEKVWSKFCISGRNFYYLTFSNRFASPADQIPELRKKILEVIEAEDKEKIDLVCHSMGGLVARCYLASYPKDHNIEKLILLGTPNLGSVGLSFNWLPTGLILFGIFGIVWVKNFWPLVFLLLGLAWELLSYFRGVMLLSPAAWAMRPNSKFLKELNKQKMPIDVKYIAIISDTKAFPHILVNLLLFREGGDGAVPLSSQRLSFKSVPNFPELNYFEIKTALPHFALPRRASREIAQALEG